MKDCVKIIYVSIKVFEQSLGGLHSYFLLPFLVQLCGLFEEGVEGSGGSRRKTLAMVTGTEEDSDMQITDFYWTLWRI